MPLQIHWYWKMTLPYATTVRLPRVMAQKIILLSPIHRNKGLFSKTVLADLEDLRQQLKDIKRVESVTTILDVPLINSPAVTLSELSKNIRTLESPDTIPGMARNELTTSPFYSNLIISPDGHTTAIQITFQRNENWHRLFQQRNDLRVQRMEEKFTAEEAAELNA